jgi:hypothetical protein
MKKTAEMVKTTQAECAHGTDAGECLRDTRDWADPARKPPRCVGCPAATTINQDAAYALGEEAFRAGFKAALLAFERAFGEYGRKSPHWVQSEQSAWDEYEPSEAVKELIVG